MAATPVMVDEGSQSSAGATMSARVSWSRTTVRSRAPGIAQETCPLAPSRATPSHRTKLTVDGTDGSCPCSLMIEDRKEISSGWSFASVTVHPLSFRICAASGWITTPPLPSPEKSW